METLQPFFSAEAAIAWAASSKAECENDSLKFELEAYKNEVEILKQDAKNTKEVSDKKIKALMTQVNVLQKVCNSVILIVSYVKTIK